VHRAIGSVVAAGLSVLLAACGSVGSSRAGAPDTGEPPSASCDALCALAGSLTVNDARGTCALELIPMGGGGPLDSPFVITMTPAAVEASGWRGMVSTRSTGPEGSLGDVGVDSASLNAGSTGLYFDVAGRWLVEYADGRCFRRFTVDVRPPAP
jgi:hypothetical protein